MTQYPLTLKFAMFTAAPKVTVTDAAGKDLFTAAKSLLSQKEEFTFTAEGKTLYQVISQESRISEIPSNWDVLNGAGEHLATISDDFTGLDLAAEVGVTNGMAGMAINTLKNFAVGEQSLKMFGVKSVTGQFLGQIAPDKASVSLQQLPLGELTAKIPLAYRLITPRYDIRWGNKIVMSMQKQRTLVADKYVLEAKHKLSAADESALLPSIVLAVFYERQQLKQLYS